MELMKISNKYNKFDLPLTHIDRALDSLLKKRRRMKKIYFNINYSWLRKILKIIKLAISTIDITKRIDKMV